MKKHFHPRQLALILVILLITSLSGLAVGKYVFTNSFTRTVTFKAELAKDFILRERTVVRQADGQYVLAEPYITNNKLAPQRYELLPGLDIPKDPHVVITGKSPIPAYLFIEVVDKTPNDAISFTLEEQWIETTLKTPKDGGTMYVYSTNGTGPAEITEDLTAYILENNKVYVSQKLHEENTDELLTVYAYLEEVQDQ